ncbi:hypothetical protein GCM10011588_47830 [Nocardia jinanensis]|uniref:Uncharacterized protein n=1 Tax=Nocardia jinanensis TaxID=382504 RepID=A0A917VVM4_9NOCA|nr:hypothetical protein GCM10011588_47830 [Nocardia jinanensis]
MPARPVSTNVKHDRTGPGRFGGTPPVRRVADGRRASAECFGYPDAGPGGESGPVRPAPRRAGPLGSPAYRVSRAYAQNRVRYPP